MAKDSQDREDLLRDAVAMVQRIELRLAGSEHDVVCGFRDDGALSIYWGQDDVMQFNAASEWRRGYWQDRMLAAYQRKLHWLDRSTPSARTQLSPTELTAQQHEAYVAHVNQRLEQLSGGISNHEFQRVGQVPAHQEVLGRLTDWLQAHHGNLRVAVHPGLKG